MSDAPPEQQVAFLVGAIIGALVIGALCGLLPFFLAKSRGRTGLGVAALVSCIVGGFILGILAAGPLMIIFTIIVLAMGRAEGTGGGFPMQSEQQYPYGVPPPYPPPGVQTPPPPPGQQRY